MKKRIDYIDIMRGIAIVLVILGHINSANVKIKSLIYSFHMPIFFFIYGLIIKEKKTTFKKIIMSRINGLMLPYYLWAFIYSNLNLQNIKYIIYGSYETIIKAGSLSSLWFLPVMFISEILFEIILYVKRKLRNKTFSEIFLGIIIILCCLVCCKLPYKENGYFMGANIAICSLIFMIMGYYASKIKIIINEKKYEKTLVIVCTIISIIGMSIYKYNNENIIGGYVLMAKGYWGKLFLFIVTGVSGSIFIMIVSSLIDRFFYQSIIKNKLIFIGKNSLIIFAIHKFLISIFENKIDYINNSFIKLCIYTIAIIYICSIFSYIIDKYVPVLSGKQRIEKRKEE